MKLGNMMGKLRPWLRSRSAGARAALTVGLGVVIAGLGVGVSSGVVAQSSPPGSDATVTVIPSSNLVDLQQVTMFGTKFTPNVTIATLECAAGAVDESGCDLSTLLYTNSDGTGAFTFKRAVRRDLTVGSGPVDCATDVCNLAAANLGDISEHAGQQITFNPNIPAIPPKITVLPSKKLIDNQLVHVVGQGFMPGTQVQLAECNVDELDYGCDFGSSRLATVAKSGKFSISNFVVERDLAENEYVPASGTIDCASSAGQCVVEAVSNTGFGGNQPITAPLTFNPAIPPVVPSLTVTPTTGLGDLQQVTIIGTGFRPGSQVILEECSSDPNNVACDYVNEQAATPGFHGEFLVTFVVHRDIALQFGSGIGGTAAFDCAVQINACAIEAFSSSPNAVTVPVTFDKHKPPVVPTITASPSSGLTDNQLVNVTVNGFPPLHAVEVVECNKRAITDANIGECDFSTAALASTPAGGGAPSTQVAVHRAIAGAAGLINCSARTGNCVLAAFPYEFYGGYYPPSGGAGVTVNAAGKTQAGVSSALQRAEAISPAVVNHAPVAGALAKLPGVAVVKLAFVKAP